MKRLSVLLAIVAVLSLVAAPAFAGNVSYKTQPSTPEEQAAAKVIEAFMDGQGVSYSVMAPLFTDDVKICCLPAMRGMQASYESKMKVALLLGSGRPVLRKSASELVVTKANGTEAEVSGLWQFRLSFGPVEQDFTFTTVWKLRKDGDGLKIYEMSFTQR